MPGDAHAEISEQLGIADAPWAAALPADQAVALVTLIREARERQRIALQKSIEEALTHVPRLLRSTLRRVLFA